MSRGTIDEGKHGCLIDSFPNDDQSEPLQRIRERYSEHHAGDSNHGERAEPISLHRFTSSVTGRISEISS